MQVLAAVIGNPVDHSLSPALHRHWLNKYEVSGHYIPIRVTVDNFATALESLARLGFCGVNVTVPHKEAALSLADHASSTARSIGAANMLTFSDDGIIAENTDAFGFTWNLLETRPDWQPRRAALLGAGGASRAVTAALIDRGAQEILVSNRSEARTRQLVEDFGTSLRPVSWHDRHAMLANCDTLINATSLGMIDKPALDICLDDLPADALVTDLVYSPLETPLLAAARRRGNPAVDGLGMLLHQAVPAFASWFGVTPKVDQSLRETILGQK